MIQTRGLHKTLGPQEVLRGVDLEVAHGETCVVLGRSGCGKSVLLKHLIGLFRPSSGRVSIDGEEITRLPKESSSPCDAKSGCFFKAPRFSTP